MTPLLSGFLHSHCLKAVLQAAEYKGIRAQCRFSVRSMGTSTLQMLRSIREGQPGRTVTYGPDRKQTLTKIFHDQVFRNTSFIPNITREGWIWENGLESAIIGAICQKSRVYPLNV